MNIIKKEEYLLFKTVYNIGYIGIGNYKTKINGKSNKCYKVWNSMLGRCYSVKVHKNNPKYIGCTVCEEWLNFQVFAKWFKDNYVEGYCLDKDIITKGNKIYSPETCCFVPQHINKLLTLRSNDRGNHPIGVYYCKKLEKFISLVSINKSQKYLGLFNTSLEAFNKYKELKEEEVKKQAMIYKDSLSITCYKALINYRIEITD